MIISLMCIILVIRHLTGEYFEKLAWNCDNSKSPYTLKVDGFIQCTMKCSSVDYCQAFSFIGKMNLCNIYALDVPCCAGPIKVGVVAFRNMRKKAPVCEFETLPDMDRINPAYKCGLSFNKQSIAFRVRGTGQAKVCLVGRSGEFFRLMFEGDPALSNSLELSCWGKRLPTSQWNDLLNSATVNDKVFEQDTWNYYWVAFTQFENDTVKVKVGQDVMPGCNITANQSCEIDFIFDYVSAFHYVEGTQSQWTFYGDSRKVSNLVARTDNGCLTNWVAFMNIAAQYRSLNLCS